MFPKEICVGSGPTNATKASTREIRRRTDVVGNFPGRNAILRLIGAVLAEQHPAWTEQCRHIGLGILTRARAALNPPTEPEELLTTVPALTARPSAIGGSAPVHHHPGLDLKGRGDGRLCRHADTLLRSTR
ncbi:transposase [Ruania sp. N2-46]|uniref:Transposase n=1 Tax=Occultella gossypii TaxID=2800820 RepID=A0ABS7SAI7_9MICO|nr:transposase [Occultella gossypii]MBZ2197369.1 transposase [Occultella gossypii]